MTKANIQRVKYQIAEWAHKSSFVEICGLIGWNGKKVIVEQVQNMSTQPQKLFALDPVKYLTFKEENDLIAIFHSHVIGNEEPSEFDIKMSENCCIPFLIYSLNTKNFHFYVPQQPESDVKIIERFKEKL